MISLFIDTHLYDIKLLILKDGEIIKEKNIIGKKNNSSYLIPSIKDIVGNFNLDEIIVVNGPGSFTGVRTGVTVAKTLAYTKKIPIKSISYLDLMAFSLDDSDIIVGLYDQNGIYIGKYHNYELVDNYEYIKNSELDSNDILKQVKTDVTIKFNKAFEFIKNKEYENPHYVNPVYVKLISAQNDKRN